MDIIYGRITDCDRIVYEASSSVQENPFSDNPYKKYLWYFTNMKRTVVAGHKAPNKLVLLLTIMDMAMKGVASRNVICNTFLLNAYLRMWKLYVPARSSFKPCIDTTLIELREEPFFDQSSANLVLKPEFYELIMRANLNIEWQKEIIKLIRTGLKITLF